MPQQPRLVKPTSIDFSQISLRNLSAEDAVHWADYLFNAPPGYLESLGIDASDLPSREDYEARLRKLVADDRSRPESKLRLLTICFGRTPIGGVLVDHLKEGQSAVFHAHIWDPAFRHLGIGTYVYPKAFRVFMERFALREILFKTPRTNRAANRVKAKLGMHPEGEEVLEEEGIRGGTVALVYRLTREQLQELRA